MRVGVAFELAFAITPNNGAAKGRLDFSASKAAHDGTSRDNL